MGWLIGGEGEVGWSENEKHRNERNVRSNEEG
jgi:hypothetical protein